jgi:phage terminase large subunit
MQNPYLDFVKRYHKAPVAFVEEVLGVTPDPWQKRLLELLAAGERKVSVRSGHGTGKSTVASWAMLWYMLTRVPVKVVVTAPTASQLFDALFGECRRWAKLLPPAVGELLEIKSDRIELKASPEEAFISARTSRAEQPDALQGIHAEFVLLVVDEAPGVSEAVFESAGGSMSGHNATTLLLGNPTRTQGYFYDTFYRLSSEWKNLHVSCVDSPRVSHEYVAEMASRYGEGSNAYRVRVLGEFPLADDDTMISLELAQAAVDRDVIQNPDATILWGLDVARFGTDSSALCKRQANLVLEPIKTWRNLDLMSLTGAVLHEWESTDFKERPAEILVDSIGLGAGVVDRLRELKVPARGINVGESPAIKGQYMNLRAELWGKAKGWLEKRDCKLPRDEQLVNELSSPRYSFMSNGKLKLESKDDMKRRGIASPDRADAFVLTFASDAATASGAYNPTWQKPIKRQVRGVV